MDESDTMAPGRGEGVKTLEHADNDAVAARLRSRGLSYRQIARQVGCSPDTAHNRVQRALAAVPAEAVEELRTVERGRLDEMSRVAWRELHRDHVLVQQGRIVRDDAGVPLVDHGGKLAALDRLLRVAERRARLDGLDLPVRQEAKLTVEHITTLDAEIERLVGELRPADA